MYLDHSFVRKS